MVDLVDKQSAGRILEQVDGDDAATHGFGGRDRNALEFGRDRAIAGLAAEVCIGDPMGRGAVDRGHTPIADDK